MAQLNASAQEERRSASTFGGVDPRIAFQMTSRTRFVASPVTAPRPTVSAFQPYFLATSTLTFYPDFVVATLANTLRAQTAYVGLIAEMVGHLEATPKANQLHIRCVMMSVHQMRMLPRIIILSVLATICVTMFLTSCGDSHSARGSTGTLSGTFRIVAGGVEYRTVPGTGDVIVRQGNHRLVNHTVSSESGFKVRLPAGSFQISSSCLQSPQETQLSASKTVTITAKMATRVDVRCLLDPTTG